MSSQEGYVKHEIKNSLGIIEFYHPLSNSLPGDILSKLASTIDDLGQNPEAKVILVKSAGDRAFCAGASFDELVAVSNFEEGKEFFSGFARVINAMRKCPKFIIGRVQGKAVGGGVGLASAVDYCFGTKHSAIKLSELAIGIGPFVVGPAVERKVGTSAMSTLTMDAKSWKSAEWAHNKGLYAHISENAEEMDSAIDELTSTLVQSNPEAMKALKKVFWEGTENWDDLLLERAALSGELVLSDFTRNAIASFKSGKR